MDYRGGIIMYPEVDFLYLNEQEMIKAGVKNMPKCIDTMEDVLKCFTKGNRSAKVNTYGYA